MVMTRTSLVLAASAAYFASPTYSQTCDQVPGGSGNSDRSEYYLPSIACKCSGSGGCDSVQFKPYSNPKYAELVISDMDGRRFEQQPTLTWERAGVRPTTNSSKQLVATTNFAGQATWKGWGTGLSDSAAINLNGMTPAAKQLVLSEYFDPNTGNDYTMIRTNIGSCMYSTHPYTYNDVEGDYSMDNFALTTEDTDLKMPILEEISQYGDVDLIGVLSTGPTWLKDNDLFDYGHLIRNSGKYMNAMVQYLAKYVQAYQDAGYKFFGIAPLNEPTLALGGDSGFPNTQWNPFGFGEYLFGHLAPYFLKNYPDIELIVNENGKDASIIWMTFVSSIQKKLNDSGILLPNVNYWGMHSLRGNTGHHTPNFYTKVVELTSVNFHPISTEVMFDITPAYTAMDYLGSWTVAESYARSLIDDINVNTTAWLDWNMVLDSRGGPSWSGKYASASIITDPDDPDVFYKNPSYYIQGHFSKLIKKGWNARKSKVSRSGPHHTNLHVAIMESPDLSERVAVFLSRYDFDVDVNYFDKDLRKEVPFTVPAKSICSLYYALK